MSRRRLLIALAVVVPLAIFVAAKLATRWRPVVAGRLIGSSIPPPLVMRASGRYVVAGNGVYTRFDLKTGQKTRLKREGIAEDGVATAKLRVGARNQFALALAKNARTSYFVLPDFTFIGGDDGYEARVLSRQTLRVAPDKSRVELALDDTYYRWNQTGHLERHVHLFDPEQGRINGRREPGVLAIARDGESVVSCNFGSIVWRSTRQNGGSRRIAVRGYRPTSANDNLIWVSAYGTLALYNVPSKGFATGVWEVVDAHNGRALWRFEVRAISDVPVFSPDEKRIIFPIAAPAKWEVHDARNGALIQTLPRVAGAQNAVFSPDNSTLYSVAGGVLYRQRAR